MPQPHRSSALSVFGSLVLIAVIVGCGAVVFAYTAGWLSPERLTPDKMVDAFAPPTGPSLGHRRNHAKGICFIGVFDANGVGSALSKAEVFTSGQYPVLGRSISPRPIRTRRTRWSGCAAWGCRSRLRTGRNGAAP
jgi:catalase